MSAQTLFMERIRETSEIISGWTKDAGTMLPKSPEEVEAFLEKGTAVVCWNGFGEPVGFGAITFDWPEGWKELGALIVEPGHRELGLGHRIVSDLISLAKEKFPESKFFALCNSKSLKIFMDNGGEVITDSGLLPNEVWRECLNCPMRVDALKSGKLCCDTPVRIK
jgi:N-acetylglutamate synthase-like GNAT family acetyltransferase